MMGDQINLIRKPQSIAGAGAVIFGAHAGLLVPLEQVGEMAPVLAFAALDETFLHGELVGGAALLEADVAKLLVDGASGVEDEAFVGVFEAEAPDFELLQLGQLHLLRLKVNVVEEDSLERLFPRQRLQLQGVQLHSLVVLQFLGELVLVTQNQLLVIHVDEGDKVVAPILQAHSRHGLEVPGLIEIVDQDRQEARDLSVPMEQDQVGQVGIPDDLLLDLRNELPPLAWVEEALGEVQPVEHVEIAAVHEESEHGVGAGLVLGVGEEGEYEAQVVVVLRFQQDGVDKLLELQQVVHYALGLLLQVLPVREQVPALLAEVVDDVLAGGLLDHLVLDCHSREPEMTSVEEKVAHFRVRQHYLLQVDEAIEDHAQHRVDDGLGQAVQQLDRLFEVVIEDVVSQERHAVSSGRVAVQRGSGGVVEQVVASLFLILDGLVEKLLSLTAQYFLEFEQFDIIRPVGPFWQGEALQLAPSFHQIAIESELHHGRGSDSATFLPMRLLWRGLLGGFASGGRDWVD